MTQEELKEKNVAITYNYENGAISHFALKRVENVCTANPAHSVLIGVMCRTCPHYHGSRGRFIVCIFNDRDDDGAGDTRHELYEEIKNRALCALDY